MYHVCTCFGCLGANHLKSPSKRSHEKMLPWYKAKIAYPDASGFNAYYGQSGYFQKWTAHANLEVEFRVYGASGTICSWYVRVCEIQLHQKPL